MAAYRIRRCLLAVTAALLNAACAATLPPPDVQTHCRNLVLDYAYHRDEMNPAQFSELFADDAVLVVLGKTYAGRAAIRQRLIDDANAPITRHLMSTIRIFPETERTARGVSYVTVYTGSPDNQEPLPQPVRDFAAIGAYHDQFVLTDAGWKIARREFKPVFRPAGATDN